MTGATAELVSAPRTLIRIWRAQIALERLPDLELFVAERSIPMFKSQRGCIGVLFARNGDQAAVLTFWQNEESILALERSAVYFVAVAAIETSGMLRGRSTVDVYEIRDGELPGLVAGSASPSVTL